MGKEQDYRVTAEIVDLAHKATAALDKRRLLRLAEKWLDLPSAASVSPRGRNARSTNIRW